MDAFLSAPITTLSGVGTARRVAYEKLGIETVQDLLYHFPRAFEHRGDVRLLKQTVAGEKCSVILTVSVEPRISRIRRGMNILKFRAFDDSGVCEITFFNQDYLRTSFPIGSCFRFYGKVERVGHHYTMSTPAFEPYVEGKVLPPLYPVYPLTEGISNKMITTHLAQVMASAAARIQDPLPEEIREREGLCTLAYALRQIHYPVDYACLHAAKKRLAFDEFFHFALAMGTVGRVVRPTGAPVCRVDSLDELDALAENGADTRQPAPIGSEAGGEKKTVAPVITATLNGNALTVAKDGTIQPTANIPRNG